jgi:hypothetical protein
MGSIALGTAVPANVFAVSEMSSQSTISKSSFRNAAPMRRRATSFAGAFAGTFRSLPQAVATSG